MPLLIGLGATERNHESLTHGLEVGNIEPDELRSPEATRKSEKQQGAIPDASDVTSQMIESEEQLVAQQRLGLSLGRATRTPDTAHRRPDQGGAGRAVKAHHGMSARDRCQPTDQRGDGECAGMRREVVRDHHVGGGNSAAPGREVVEVDAVGLERGGR